MTTTSWTEGEYGRVAEALRYPLSPEVTRSYGMDIYQVAVRLRTQLYSTDALTKARVLELADAINRSETELYTKGAARPDIERVGDIVFNQQNGVKQRSDLIAQQRQKLSDLLGIPINPAAGAATAGGINGTWSCLCPSTPKPSRARPARSWKSLRRT